MDILILISFTLKKPKQNNMFWYVRIVLHTKQESEAIESEEPSPAVIMMSCLLNFPG